MRVIVTGHLGYIGRVLLPILIERGHEVTGIDIGLFEQFDFIAEKPKINEIRKDIRKITTDDIKNHDAIIHLAALSNDPMGELNPGLTEEINHVASLRLAKMAKEVGIKRFIFSSSCSVYGRVEDDSKILFETDKTSPITEYAKSKVKTENEVSRLADNDFTPIFQRNATVYGYSHSLRLDLVVNNLTASALYSNEINILSDGRPWRPLIHVEDLSRVFADMLDAPKEKVHNQIFNVGFSEENYQVKGIAKLIQENIPGMGISVAKSFDPDSRSYNVNFDKLKDALNLKNEWNVKKGSKEIYENLKNSSITKQDFENKACYRLKQLEQVLDQFPNFLSKQLDEIC
ncbi:ADP-L-glycero-D-manno-heptose-6-epimerase [Candidatus Lokiarchaeum ossiferum]|uniref:ADP-L-glycero-D-manno-heptose-6-epimerase n=1 Tax=Candidatus Lokiarchaeum ossiferum TaxID=2951803 RepID=A0ABY6HYU7_9ARCH|nr:ADP-L-glycero-D-manno-heptose-6-epimerase [Candidatus Lokiarchaeum sp. B-35]